MRASILLLILSFFLTTPSFAQDSFPEDSNGVTPQEIENTLSFDEDPVLNTMIQYAEVIKNLIENTDDSFVRERLETHLNDVRCINQDRYTKWQLDCQPIQADTKDLLSDPFAQ